MHRRTLCTLFSLVLLALAKVASAQPVVAPIEDTPIYDPASKRYFALMVVVPDPHQYVGAEWVSAGRQAQGRAYKGVNGRLAIVDSFEVHEFLLRTFHPQPYQYIWIGLRYWCGLRKAEWSDGRTLKPGSFQAWDKQWNQDPTAACVMTKDERANLKNWAPVAYSPKNTWIVKGQHKVYQWYYIEYPTGHP